MRFLFLVVMMMLVPVFVFVGMGGTVVMSAIVMMLMAMFAAVAMLVAFVLILVVGVGRAFMDSKLHAFDFLPLLPLEVHVEIAEVQLGQFPLEGGRLDAEVDKGAHGHVAGDAGKTVEEENFHGCDADG